MTTKIRYSEDIRQRAVRAAAAGAIDGEIADILGCAQSTLSRWKRAHPDFARALEDARLPDESDSAIARLEARKEKAEKLLDRYLDSLVIESTHTREDADGKGFKRVKLRHLPEQWLIERLLGPGEQLPEQEFRVVIDVAQPPQFDDDDEDEWDDDDLTDESEGDILDE